ncbi:hypothetical protein [Acidovorax sp. SUPP2825]|uniref:hypothetical protein n=1 Tax=Acidovorax sp. SUPP2825 TaxID=2920879 RepID=UPI0023DE373A|nr:hypothetical protein [Acidovorax sp. SUPP2825]GKS97512.1 hypothetical protein AVAK2825_23275 [Acidovorax sp. SUPP2825]
MGNCIGAAGASASVHHRQGDGPADTRARGEAPAPPAAFGVDEALAGLRAREHRIDGLLGPRAGALLASPERWALEIGRDQVRSSAWGLQAVRQSLDHPEAPHMRLGADPAQAARLMAARATRLAGEIDAVIERGKESAKDQRVLAGADPLMRSPHAR